MSLVFSLFSVINSNQVFADGTTMMYCEHMVEAAADGADRGAGAKRSRRNGKANHLQCSTDVPKSQETGHSSRPGVVSCVRNHILLAVFAIGSRGPPAQAFIHPCG